MGNVIRFSPRNLTDNAAVGPKSQYLVTVGKAVRRAVGERSDVRRIRRGSDLDRRTDALPLWRMRISQASSVWAAAV